MRSIRLLLAALAATFALVAAGCGSSETNDYRGEVKEVQEKYFDQLNAFASDVAAKAISDPAGAGAALDGLAETATKLADEVAQIDPPDDKQQLADQLVGSYRSLAEASTDLKEALQAKDAEGIKAAMDALNRANEAQTSAVEAFNAAD